MGARNGFGVFVVPMTGDLGWTRTEISVAIAVGILVNGLSQPFLGRIYDKYGGRIVISLSLLVLGVMTMLLALTSNFGTNFGFRLDFGVVDVTLSASLLFLVTIYGLVMSTASSGVSLVTVHAVLAKWFYRRRGHRSQHLHGRHVGWRPLSDPVRRLPDHLGALARGLDRAGGFRAGACAAASRSNPEGESGRDGRSARRPAARAHVSHNLRWFSRLSGWWSGSSSS